MESEKEVRKEWIRRKGERGVVGQSSRGIRQITLGERVPCNRDTESPDLNMWGVLNMARQLHRKELLLRTVNSSKRDGRSAGLGERIRP